MKTIKIQLSYSEFYTIGELKTKKVEFLTMLRNSTFLESSEQL